MFMIVFYSNTCVYSWFRSTGIAVYVHDSVLQELLCMFELCMFMIVFYRNRCICS